MGKTTLNVDDEMMEQAMKVTGIHEKTALVNYALRELLKTKAGERLIARGGTDTGAVVPSRKRSRTG